MFLISLSIYQWSEMFVFWWSLFIIWYPFTRVNLTCNFSFSNKKIILSCRTAVLLSVINEVFSFKLVNISFFLSFPQKKMVVANYVAWYEPEQSSGGVLQKRCCLKFCKIHRKALLEACSFIKTEALAQVFLCELCKISKNTFFTGHKLKRDLIFTWYLIFILYIFPTVVECFFLIIENLSISLTHVYKNFSRAKFYSRMFSNDNLKTKFFLSS